MRNKNQRLLESFTKYCEESPDERFWQALRNWARIEVDPTINFIVAKSTSGNEADTFYWVDEPKKDPKQLTIPFTEK